MRATTLLALIALALAAACSQEPGQTGGTWRVAPDDGGRADDYYSTNAREFALTGQAHVTLPEGFAEMDEAARASALQRLVDGRVTTVSRAIKSHIDGVLRGVNEGRSEEDLQYFVFAKNGAADARENVEVLDDGRARFAFEIELVGSYYLMSKVAPETGADRRTFPVEVSDWGGANAETVEVEIRGSQSRDAFPRYAELFEDGVYDIAVHFGGDYNEGRHDLDTARWLVDEALLAGGWQNQGVQGFDQLTIDSPPFTRTLLVEGREIEARVYVYHSDMVDAANEARLADVMRTSFAERDVVVYSGHAGPGSGFVLDYQPRYEIRPSEFPSLPLAERYQIYVFDGCQTYRTYVDDLLRNERKTLENVDIVTTVNTTPFAVGYQLLWELVHWITLTDSAGNHLPLSWSAILRGLNTRRYPNVHYGVHGVDGDPELNPHGGHDMMCQPCQSDGDCGPGGNLCLTIGGQGVCGVACTTDRACGAGNRCARLADIEEYFYIPRQCIPRDLTCEPPEAP